MIIRKAVIPAAGLGTRFLPATKSMPKEMLPIIDIPTIQFGDRRYPHYFRKGQKSYRRSF